jgi:hypothetical protein
MISRTMSQDVEILISICWTLAHVDVIDLSIILDWLFTLMQIRIWSDKAGCIHKRMLPHPFLLFLKLLNVLCDFLHSKRRWGA